GKVYDNSGVGVLLGILALIPLINVIVLLVVNGAATRVLREHGIKVGLLGASVPAELRSTGSLHGLTFGLIGGIGAIALLCGGAAFWLFRSLDFMDGTWPDPLADQGGRPGMNLANSVTLHISGVDDEYTIDAVFGKLRGLAD